MSVGNDGYKVWAGLEVIVFAFIKVRRCLVHIVGDLLVFPDQYNYIIIRVLGMGQTLRINQKEYVPSAELGKLFGYTSDYISKLAREEKVLGTRVGRQWYVEPESLRTYIQQLEVEKKIAQENLSRLRKLEHKHHANQVTATDALSLKSRALTTAGQALAVTLCGVFLGALFLPVYTHQLGWQDFEASAASIGQRIVGRIAEGLAVLPEVDLPHRPRAVANPLFGTVSEEGVMAGETVGPQYHVSGQYTTFPSLPLSARVAGVVVSGENETRSTHQEGYELPFSDEVVVTETEEVLRVRPVFRDAMGELYQLSAIPVEE